MTLLNESIDNELLEHRKLSQYSHQPLKIRLKLLKKMGSPMKLNAPPSLLSSSSLSPSQASHSGNISPIISTSSPLKNKPIKIKSKQMHKKQQKRPFVQSCPSPVLKRLKLTLKDPPISSTVSKKTKKKANGRLNSKKLKTFKKPESLFLMSNHSSDPPNTKERAKKVVHWALSNNTILVRDYHITMLLGWGGCGAVLSGIRKSDSKEVLGLI